MHIRAALMDLAHLSEKEGEGRKKKEEKLKLRWRHLGGEGVGEEGIQEKMDLILFHLICI